MADILICSTIRDMMKHPNWESHKYGSPLKTFTRQVDLLRSKHSIRVCVVEYDSKDGTKEYLAEWSKTGDIDILSEDIGAPVYRSLPANKGQDRLTLWAQFKNKALSALRDEKWILWVEPDIFYSPMTLTYLFSGAGDIRSPLSFSDPFDLMTFYDPLSTRDIDGNKFAWAWPPANNMSDRLRCIQGIPFEVSSTFNCFCLINAQIVRDGVRFSATSPGESEASSFCRDARKLGYSVVLHPAVRYSIIHPLAKESWNESDDSHHRV